MSDRSIESFWARVHKVEMTGCWVWRGHINKQRYGTWTFWENGKGRTVYPHRYAYELLVGPIPEGIVLDHLCLNRTCCNPAHLDPISCAENVRRGLESRQFPGFNESKTHCPAGHPYDGDNLHVRANGMRDCRTCARDRRREERKDLPSKPRPRKDFCVNGHAMTEDNIIGEGKTRACRECARERVRAYRAKDKIVTHRTEVCKNGHVMDEENSPAAADGTRSCKACARDRMREWRERNPSDRGPAFVDRTHCTEGHPYDEANTYVTSKGHRQCRTCNRRRETARTERRRAAKAATVEEK